MKQSQPLANVLFRLAPESVIQLKAVTPAELMYLCATHRARAKKDPVERLTEIPPAEEDSRIKDLQETLTKLERSIENAETDPQLSEDVREKRIDSLRNRIEAKMREIAEVEVFRTLRNLTPNQERNRLQSKYNEQVVKAFYPGGVPTLPKDFREARQLGAEAELPEVKFSEYVVGADKLTGKAPVG